MASISKRSPFRLRSIGFVAVVVMVFMAGCGPSRSADEWLGQLKDPDVLLRRQACRELGNLPAEATRTVPVLAETLRDENAYVRHDAATALGKLGPEARSAVAFLIAALSDKDKRVHAAAGAAIKKIDPDAATKAGVR
jgi:HEAT repeat protein